MIETRDLTRKFNGLTAVDNLNLKVRDGEVFGFIGPNGAGKTTTIRMICTLIAPTSGSVLVNGLDVNDPNDAIKIRSMIGFLPEVPGLYETLSAHRNLDFYASLYGVPADKRERRIKELLELLGIWDRRDDTVGKFSKGMKQKIAIARALVHEPEFLFLDEPTSGLDPVASLTVRNFLLELKKEGRTIFINTHNLDDAERLCDTIGVMYFEEEASAAGKGMVKLAEIYRYEDLADLTQPVYDGSVLILDYSNIANDTDTLKRITSELKAVARDNNGDVAAIGHDLIVVTPRGLKIDRNKIRGGFR